MKTIIHPTDFSENASKALAFAIDFSKKFNAELILLHVENFPTIMSSSKSVNSYSKLEDQKKASMVEQLKSYAANYIEKAGADLKIQFKAKLHNSIVKGILETIDETEADLVVVGTKGQNKLKRIFVGSTTKGLVTSASCPVLAIPGNAVFREIKRIVYASDFDQHDIAVIKKLVFISQTYHANIAVLHLSQNELKEKKESAAFQQKLTDEVDYLHLKYETQASYNIAQSLASYLKLNQADLLVMFEKENTGINSLFYRSMVKQFVDHAVTIPFMSYNTHSVSVLREKILSH